VNGIDPGSRGINPYREGWWCETREGNSGPKCIVCKAVLIAARGSATDFGRQA